MSSPLFLLALKELPKKIHNRYREPAPCGSLDDRILIPGFVMLCVLGPPKLSWRLKIN
jgi:hypothetical protein